MTSTLAITQDFKTWDKIIHFDLWCVVRLNPIPITLCRIIPRPLDYRTPPPKPLYLNENQLQHFYRHSKFLLFAWNETLLSLSLAVTKKAGHKAPLFFNTSQGMPNTQNHSHEHQASWLNFSLDGSEWKPTWTLAGLVLQMFPHNTPPSERRFLLG